jgi:hypothetical protein
MKLYRVLYLLVIFCVTLTCSAENVKMNNLEGINDNIYYALCGIWEDRKIIDEEEFDQAVFTWGKGKFTQDSIIIDLGHKRTSDMWYDPPAIFMVGDKAKKILSVEMLDEKQINLYLEGFFWDDEVKREVKKTGIYTIHINDDKTIWIDYHSPKKNIKRVLYKISGPKRPKNI